MVPSDGDGPEERPDSGVGPGRNAACISKIDRMRPLEVPGRHDSRASLRVWCLAPTGVSARRAAVQVREESRPNPSTRAVECILLASPPGDPSTRVQASRLAGGRPGVVA